MKSNFLRGLKKTQGWLSATAICITCISSPLSLPGQTATIRSAPSMLSARYDHEAAYLNGIFYNIGGAGSRSVEFLNSQTNQRGNSPSLLNSRQYFAAVASRDTLYVIGGNGIRLCEAYTPGTDSSWRSALAPLPITPQSVTGGFDYNNNNLYIMVQVGGSSSIRLFRWDLDKPTTSWEEMGTLPTSRHRLYSSIAVIDNEVWMIGGNCTSDKVDIWDGITNTWRVGPSLPYVKTRGSAFYSGGYVVYVAGGYGCDVRRNADHNTFYIDPNKNNTSDWTWTSGRNTQGFGVAAAGDPETGLGIASGGFWDRVNSGRREPHSTQFYIQMPPPPPIPANLWIVSNLTDDRINPNQSYAMTSTLGDVVTETVSLHNPGNFDLTINEISDARSFSLLNVPDIIQAGETIEVPLLFAADQLGTIQEKISISTSSTKTPVFNLLLEGTTTLEDNQIIPYPSVDVGLFVRSSDGFLTEDTIMYTPANSTVSVGDVLHAENLTTSSISWDINGAPLLEGKGSLYLDFTDAQGWSDFLTSSTVGDIDGRRYYFARQDDTWSVNVETGEIQITNNSGKTLQDPVSFPMTTGIENGRLYLLGTGEENAPAKNANRIGVAILDGHTLDPVLNQQQAQVPGAFLVNSNGDFHATLGRPFADRPLWGILDDYIPMGTLKVDHPKSPVQFEIKGELIGPIVRFEESNIKILEPLTDTDLVELNVTDLTIIPDFEGGATVSFDDLATSVATTVGLESIGGDIKFSDEDGTTIELDQLSLYLSDQYLRVSDVIINETGIIATASSESNKVGDIDLGFKNLRFGFPIGNHDVTLEEAILSTNESEFILSNAKFSRDGVFTTDFAEYVDDNFSTTIDKLSFDPINGKYSADFVNLSSDSFLIQTNDFNLTPEGLTLMSGTISVRDTLLNVSSLEITGDSVVFKDTFVGNGINTLQLQNFIYKNGEFTFDEASLNVDGIPFKLSRLGDDPSLFSLEGVLENTPVFGDLGATILLEDNSFDIVGIDVPDGRLGFMVIKNARFVSGRGLTWDVTFEFPGLPGLDSILQIKDGEVQVARVAYDFSLNGTNPCGWPIVPTPPCVFNLQEIGAEWLPLQDLIRGYALATLGPRVRVPFVSGGRFSLVSAEGEVRFYGYGMLETNARIEFFESFRFAEANLKAGKVYVDGKYFGEGVLFNGDIILFYGILDVGATAYAFKGGDYGGQVRGVVQVPPYIPVVGGFDIAGAQLGYLFEVFSGSVFVNILCVPIPKPYICWKQICIRRFIFFGPKWKCFNIPLICVDWEWECLRIKLGIEIGPDGFSVDLKDGQNGFNTRLSNFKQLDYTMHRLNKTNGNANYELDFKEDGSRALLVLATGDKDSSMTLTLPDKTVVSEEDVPLVFEDNGNNSLVNNRWGIVRTDRMIDENTKEFGYIITDIELGNFILNEDSVNGAYFRDLPHGQFGATVHGNHSGVEMLSQLSEPELAYAEYYQNLDDTFTVVAELEEPVDDALTYEIRSVAHPLPIEGSVTLTTGTITDFSEITVPMSTILDAGGTRNSENTIYIRLISDSGDTWRSVGVVPELVTDSIPDSVKNLEVNSTEIETIITWDDGMVPPELELASWLVTIKKVTGGEPEQNILVSGPLVRYDGQPSQPVETIAIVSGLTKGARYLASVSPIAVDPISGEPVFGERVSTEFRAGSIVGPEFKTQIPDSIALVGQDWKTVVEGVPSNEAGTLALDVQTSTTVTINPLSRNRFEFSIPAEDINPYSGSRLKVLMTLTEGELSETQRFHISVGEITSGQSNYEVVSFAPNIITAGETMSYDIIINPDIDEYLVKVAEGPDGLRSTGNGIRWTPGIADLGTHRIRLEIESYNSEYPHILGSVITEHAFDVFVKRNSNISIGRIVNTPCIVPNQIFEVSFDLPEDWTTYTETVDSTTSIIDAPGAEISNLINGDTLISWNNTGQQLVTYSAISSSNPVTSGTVNLSSGEIHSSSIFGTELCEAGEWNVYRISQIKRMVDAKSSIHFDYEVVNPGLDELILQLSCDDQWIILPEQVIVSPGESVTVEIEVSGPVFLTEGYSGSTYQTEIIFQSSDRIERRFVIVEYDSTTGLHWIQFD